MIGCRPVDDIGALGDIAGTDADDGAVPCPPVRIRGGGGDETGSVYRLNLAISFDCVEFEWGGNGAPCAGHASCVRVA